MTIIVPTPIVPFLSSQTHSGYVLVPVSADAGDYVNFTMDGSAPTCNSLLPRANISTIVVKRSANVSAVSCRLDPNASVVWPSLVIRQRLVVSPAPFVVVSIAFTSNVTEANLDASAMAGLRNVVAAALNVSTDRVELAVVRQKRRRALLATLRADATVLASSSAEAQAILLAARGADFATAVRTAGLQVSVAEVSASVVVPEGYISLAQSGALGGPKPWGTGTAAWFRVFQVAAAMVTGAAWCSEMHW
jgi:hypothetical protein